MEIIVVITGVLQLVFTLVVLFFVYKNNSRKEINRNFALLQDVSYHNKQDLKEEIRQSRLENKNDMQALRKDVEDSLVRNHEAVMARVHESQSQQLAQLDSFAKQLHELTKLNDERLERLRAAVEQKLTNLQQNNQDKLEQIRRTVDEKLHDTLEKRLGESFRLVSERLEQVHQGLGEMQVLATGVGDLKKVLSNVKTRGIWGEIQLGNLLEQVLAPEQYERNVATVPQSNERVEFAIKLPGRGEGEHAQVWLPIDAKFPQEDYQRILEAQEQGDAVMMEAAAKSLENRIKGEAKDIRNKYIAVPATTDFAVMFLPVEGLYAEVLRRNGLCEKLMQEYKVVIAGPTTLAALLNSLQMGFRSIAIEKRSAEVWSVLGAVKTEFGKFGDLLDKTHKKLQEATDSIDTAVRKTRTIERRLRTVQELPHVDTVELLENK